MAEDFAGPFNFTEASIRRLCEAVARGDVEPGEWKDSGSQVGLSVRVGPRGGVFYSLRRVAHKLNRKRLGRSATMRVATAREMATQVSAGNEAGSRPIRVGSSSIIAGEVFEQYLEASQDGTFIIGHRPLAKSTAKSYQELWKPHVEPGYGKKPLAMLAAGIQSLHEKFGNRPGAQKRLMQLLKNVFTFAAHKDWWGEPNPVIDVKTGKPLKCRGTTDRERFLSEGELARFVAYVEQSPEPWQDYWQLLLLTGIRKATLTAMAWKDIDLYAQEPTWRVGVTKNGLPLVVPLLPEAVAILEQRRARNSDSPWVFPSNRSKSGHLENVDAAWIQLKKASGLEDVRIHDIRRTAGTVAVRDNSLPAVARFLGQRTLRAVQVYARASDKDARLVGGTVAAALKQSKSRQPPKG